MSRDTTSGERSSSRILIVDDHPIVCEGLAARINAQPDLECCGFADTVESALAAIEKTRPHLVLVDISLKSGSGLDLIKRVRSKDPTAKLLVISMHGDGVYAERALRAGASGYLHKQASGDSVVDAIRQVLGGRVYLSPEMAAHQLCGTVGPTERVHSGIAALTDRELQVFELIGRGLATKAIADELRLSVHTIDTYRDKIKTKLEIKGTPALIQRAVQWLVEQR